MAISIISGQSGDYLIDSSNLITSYKFSHFVIGASTATVQVVKIRGVDVSTARNYNNKILDPGYVMSAGNGDYFDAIQFRTNGRVEGYFYTQAVSPIITSVTVSSSDAGHSPMSPKIIYSNAGNSGSKVLNWRVRNYVREASIRTAAIQAAYDASATIIGAFNLTELVKLANKTYNESVGTILQSGQETVYFLNTDTSVRIPNLTYYAAASSDNIFDVTLAETFPYVWTSSPLFQIYP